MLNSEERRRVAAEFQVADEQVARDHLISHILAALPALDLDLVFYGGTALARTHLPSFRLSEDIDLLARDRGSAVRAVEQSVPRLLRREFGQTRWLVAPSAAPRESVPALLSTEDGLQVRIQIGALDADRSRWPAEVRAVDMRYGDVRPAALRVPTLAAFVGMKALAWEDRHAARDLADLFALHEIGAIDAGVIALLRKVAGRAVLASAFRTMPEQTRTTWSVQLDHQMASAPDPDLCLTVVHDAWTRATDANGH